MARGIELKEKPLMETATETPDASAEPTCVHHWIIDSPAGATSQGVCKICGEKRPFQNYVGDFIWEGDSTESYGTGGWKKPVTELVRPGGGEEGGEETSVAPRGRPEKLYF